MPSNVGQLLAEIALGAGCCCLLSACGDTAADSTGGSPATPAAGPQVQADPTGGWPSALPADAVGPAEHLDAAGKVIPPRNGAYINEDSVFVPGILRYEQSEIGISGNIKALNLNSGVSGERQLSWAVYRLTLGGQPPGAVGCDVNLLAGSDKSVSSYWVGLADYASGHWSWRGPFSDHHVRLSTVADLAQGADYLSELGNLFVCIAAYDGASVDVVGVAANPLDPADTEPPPMPKGLSAAAAGRVLELSWSAVPAEDLAGYRIYSASTPFLSADAEGVVALPYLEDTPHHLLPATRRTWARVSAVDLSGNESALSLPVDATPRPDPSPVTMLEVNRPSGLPDAEIELAAAGAAEYRWDLDGDGVFELTGDTDGNQPVDTSAIGIQRLEVIGSDGAGGLSGAGASVLIVENEPPVAVLTADVTAGDVPLTVQLDGSESYDVDGVIVDYDWDLDGDGVFGESDGEREGQGHSQLSYAFDAAGYYETALRVTDDIGARNTAVVVVRVRGWVVTTVDASVGEEAQRSALAVVDGAPALAYVDAHDHQLRYVRALSDIGIYRGDWDEVFSVDADCWAGSYPALAVVDGHPAIAYEDAYNYDLKYIRAQTTTGAEFYDWQSPIVVDSSGWVGVDPSLALVDGNPAISYYDLSKANLKYARSTTPQGQATGDWSQRVTVDSDGVVGASSSLAVVDGAPAISYLDWGNRNVKYARASTPTGGGLGDWPTVVTIDDSGYAVDGHALLVVAGLPAVCYYTELNLRTLAPFDLLYRRSTTPSGGHGGDWAPAVTAAAEGMAGSFSSLALIGNRPALSYFDTTAQLLRYSRASSPTGGEDAQWALGEAVDSVPYDGYATTMISVTGSPAIAYVVGGNEAGTDRSLKYAFLYE